MPQRPGATMVWALILLILIGCSACSGCRRPAGREEPPAVKPLAGRRGTLPLEGRGEIALPAGASRIEPSPRGDLLAYHLREGGAFLADRDGRDRGPLPGDGYWGPATWSSDGKRLCYFTCPAPPAANLKRGRAIVYSVDDRTARSIALGAADPGTVEPAPLFEQGDEEPVVLYAQTGVYRATAKDPAFSRLETGPPVGRGTGPFAASQYRLTARPGPTGGVEVLNQWEVIRRVGVAGEVTDLAFNPVGNRIAIICQEKGEWRLYSTPSDQSGETVLLDSGSGKAGSLSWSYEGRFLGYTTGPADGAPGESAARFIDVANGALAHLAYTEVMAVAWADPLGALVLAQGRGKVRALSVAVGGPTRVKSIRVLEHKPLAMDPGNTDDSGLLNGSEFTVASDEFSIHVTYDRLVTREMALPALQCTPGPPPELASYTGDGESIIHLRFETGVPVKQTVRLKLAAIAGGEEVNLTVVRLPEAGVSVASLDRPELGSRPPELYDSFSLTLGLGTKRFRIEFAQPMDRRSVEAVLRERLAAAQGVEFAWEGDRALDLAVTCQRETEGLNVDLMGAQSLDGAPVWAQPSFPYAARDLVHLAETLPDGQDARGLGTIEGDFASPLLSPDGSLVAYAETVGCLGEPITYYWSRAIAGGKPVRLPRAPVAWFPNSRRLLCGTDVVDALTGETLRPLPGEEPGKYWGGSLSPSGRRAVAICPADWEQRTAVLVVYDLEAWTARNAGVVTGRLVSDTPSAMPPAWSPDERRIAIMHVKPDNKTVLALLDLDTLAMTPLVDSDPYEMPDLGGPYRLAVWSPDGRYIVQRGNGGWSVITPDGRLVCALGGMSWTWSPPAWSPDGGRLLYTAGGEQPEVCVAAVPDGEATHIGKGVAVGWSPDGSRIIWATRER